MTTNSNDDATTQDLTGALTDLRDSYVELSLALHDLLFHISTTEQDEPNALSRNYLKHGHHGGEGQTR